MNAPTPEFRAHLEWQIASALRREARFAEPVAPSRAPGLRLAAMLLVAFALGSMVAVGAAEVQESRERDRLTAAVAAQLELLQVRLNLAQAELANARQRVEIGAAGRQTVLDAEREVRTREAAIARARLDIEEIMATSQPPKNELDAPKVGSRDFVQARLLLELETAQARLLAEQAALAELNRRFSVGTATPAAQIQAELELVRAEAALEEVRAKMALRKRVVDGDLKGEEVAKAERRTEVTVSLDRAQREHHLARLRLQAVKRLAEVGLVTELEVKRLEVELLEKEVELQTLRRSLEALGGKRE